MTLYPEFPDFKPLQLEDRAVVHDLLWRYQPETSELTFTNLFIWRAYYHVTWALYEDWLLFLCIDSQGQAYALPPVGPTPRADVTRTFLTWIREERNVPQPRIERADARLVSELVDLSDFSITSTRDHFDYLYDREDLATLSGRRYSAKRNHINKFKRVYGDGYSFEPLAEDNVGECIEVAHAWCEKRRCDEDLSLMEERDAVFESLEHFSDLAVQGGVVRVDGQVQAFTIGEMLNAKTLVVHIEKADPDIQGLYPLINQQFVQHCCEGAAYINREQDLGEPGLRKAKESYHPERLVEKARITLV